MWDIKGFYDSIDWAKVFEAAPALEFPGLVLALELEMHMATRISKEDGSFSETIEPKRSIVAGSRRGLDFARVLMFFVLEKRARELKLVKHFSWIDDVVQRTDGTKKVINLVHAEEKTAPSGFTAALAMDGYL